jgi:hypothetical protein
MVIVGIAGTIDSDDRLEPVVDVEQIFEDRYIARKRDEKSFIQESEQGSTDQLQESGSAILAIVGTQTFLSQDDIDNISRGSVARTMEMLQRYGD